MHVCNYAAIVTLLRSRVKYSILHLTPLTEVAVYVVIFAITLEGFKGRNIINLRRWHFLHRLKPKRVIHQQKIVRLLYKQTSFSGTRNTVAHMYDCIFAYMHKLSNRPVAATGECVICDASAVVVSCQELFTVVLQLCCQHPHMF